MGCKCVPWRRILVAGGFKQPGQNKEESEQTPGAFGLARFLSFPLPAARTVLEPRLCFCAALLPGAAHVPPLKSVDNGPLQHPTHWCNPVQDARW